MLTSFSCSWTYKTSSPLVINFTTAALSEAKLWKWVSIVYGKRNVVQLTPGWWEVQRHCAYDSEPPASQGECRRALPSTFWIWFFSMRFCKKCVSVIFNLVKWNFTMWFPPWQNAFAHHLKKIHWCPPTEKILPTPMLGSHAFQPVNMAVLGGGVAAPLAWKISRQAQFAQKSWI